jgi:hypothetical protein
MESCECPGTDAIETIPQGGCPENIGQIVRLIFVRAGNAIAATEAAAKLLATYTPLLIETDDTKIQVTPGLLEGLVIPPSTGIFEGGNDNSTPLGRRLLVGESNVDVEALLRNIPEATMQVLRKYRCEDYNLGLEAAFINEFGQIVFRKVGLTMRGFPLYSFFAGSKGNDGKNTQDKANIGWSMDADWRNGIFFVKPTDFDPRFNFG